MAQVIDKGSSVSLPLQVRNLLAERIEASPHLVGQKIDSIRKLAGELEVSPVTVIEALKLLEKDDYIIRIPVKGVFVNDKIFTERKLIDIVFAFPEESISPEKLKPEEYALNSEIYRGLLVGAGKFGAKIHFEHFQDKPNDLQLRHQLKRLQSYDAAVFAGTQLLTLQKEFAQQKPVFQFVGYNDCRSNPIINVDYDRHGALCLLARHAVASGYRSAGVISLVYKDNFFQSRAAHFRQICAEYGLETPDEMVWEFHGDNVNHQAALRKKMRGARPDFIFSNHAEFILDIYEVAADCGIKFGKDTAIAGIASGLTFRGLLPSFTYVRVPMYEMAENIINVAVKAIRNGLPISSMPQQAAVLVVGKSTVFDNPNLRSKVCKELSLHV